MPNKVIRVLSNFRAMSEIASTDATISHQYSPDSSSFRDLIKFIRQCMHSDVVILNVDQRRLMLAGFLKYVIPTLRFKLVSADLILRPPITRADRLKAFVKKLLFARVDRFILYFKNTDGYQRFYGIDNDRVVYVPFKVNGWKYLASRHLDGSNGDYVLCAGRTLRDLATFVRAMRRINCPAMLLQQRREIVEAHGTKEWSGELPPNVRLVIDDSDSLETYLDFINSARLMVIPRYKYDIAPTGISTYLVAMALQKCVIISEGPGAEDVLTDQAVVVPAEDDRTLGEQIELLWSDHERRAEIAARAREYAHSLGGEERLLSDILKTSLLTLTQDS